jgi:hypothetical protein
MTMENAERTVQIVTMVLHSDIASTSAVALSTQTILKKSGAVGAVGAVFRVYGG